MKNVAIFGTGYVGCVTAACLARDGHRVIGVDVDRGKVDSINRGASPVAEPGLDELIARETAAGRLSATCDAAVAVKQTEFALIAVGTPSDRTGAVSVGAIEGVIESIGAALVNADRPYVVVVRSTLLPGILEQRLGPLLAAAAGRDLGPGLRLCNNPEFLRESSALKDYDAPPYVVVGATDDWNAQEVLDLYDSVAAPKIVTDARTAALLKYACNAYHAMKVAFANEIGAMAKAFGADGTDVMDLVCRDTKLNVSRAYLRPGFSFGGSCLPKDLRAMIRFAEREAISLPLLRSVLPSNAEHLQRAVEMIEARGRQRIGIAGLSFKAGTDDLRESPFVTLAETLIGRGHEVKIYDPGVSISRLRGRNLAYVDQHLPHLAALLVETPQELLEHASLVLCCTEIADALSPSPLHAHSFIDLRKCLVSPEAQEEVVSAHAQ